MQEYINAQFDELTCGVVELKQQTPEIEKIANVCTDALRRGHKIIFCGNGGSAAQSQHLAAELVGRYKMNRPAMNSISLTVDTSNLTAAEFPPPLPKRRFRHIRTGQNPLSRFFSGAGKTADLRRYMCQTGNFKTCRIYFQLINNLYKRCFLFYRGHRNLTFFNAKAAK